MFIKLNRLCFISALNIELVREAERSAGNSKQRLWKRMRRVVKTEEPQHLCGRASISSHCSSQDRWGSDPTPFALPSEDFKVSSENCMSMVSLPCPEGSQSMCTSCRVRVLSKGEMGRWAHLLMSTLKTKREKKLTLKYALVPFATNRVHSVVSVLLSLFVNH